METEIYNKILGRNILLNSRKVGNKSSLDINNNLRNRNLVRVAEDRYENNQEKLKKDSKQSQR